MHFSIFEKVCQHKSKQKAAIRTTHGLTDWFDIEQGVRQRCILSPHLFDIYSEQIMRNALEDLTGGVRIGGRVITNLSMQMMLS